MSSTTPLVGPLVIESHPGLLALMSLIFGAVCCFICPCCAPFCLFFALRSKYNRLVFDDVEQRINIYKKSYVGNYGATPSESVKYQDVASFQVMYHENVKVNNSQAASLIIRLNNGADIYVSAAEEIHKIQERASLGNDHLNKIKYNQTAL
jgi:hypothetical protein